MKNVLEYKGYHAKIEYDAESKALRGKIEGINDYVDFEAADAVSIEQEFHFAVDDYLDFCEEVGKEPEKEYKGTFNVRISPELHKKIALSAFKNDCSLNAEVEKAIAGYVNLDTFETRALAESVKKLTETIQMGQGMYENEKIVNGSNIICFGKVKPTYKTMG